MSSRLLPQIAAALAALLTGLLACGAAAALAHVGDGRSAQPGDVVEPTPAVDTTAPIPQDAGPVPVDAGLPLVATEQPVTAEPTPTAIADDGTTAPVPTSTPRRDEAAPAVDEPAPSVDERAPRIDPAGERAPETPPQAAEEADVPDGIGFGGVPALAYDADNGFGFGVIGNMFIHDGETRPYRASVILQLFMTTKLVHDHHLTADWLKVAGLPLRLWSRLGYLQSRSQNYCGLGGDVACDPGLAEAEAARLNLEGDEADTFVQHYYQRRFINPYAQLQARWALVEAPARFEVTGGLRGGWFIPGTWDDEDGDGGADLAPFPGSLYAGEFPEGEPGFETIAQLGVMLDTRDNEPAPNEGVWLEASARASSPFIGSAWQWAGGNVTLRGYAPLDDDRTLVLCNRLIFDGVIGDPPIQSLVRLGGSNDFYVLGGADLGRGIRAQRYIGKLRVIDTTELRWRFLDTEVVGQRLAFAAAGFVDAGLVGRELTEPGPMPLQAGGGGGLRVAWNENFIIRFDVGFSSVEAWQPMIYLLIANPF